MKKIYVIQMHTNTIPSKVIRLFTMYKYSHIAISFDEKCDVVYSFGRKTLYSILNSGFTIEYKNGAFFRKFKDTKCRIYEVSVTNEQYNYLYSTIEYMKDNQDDYRYDFVGIVLRYIGIPITFKNKYVCSYFVAQLLKDAKIYDFDKQPCFVEPKDFENIDMFNLIYTGKYRMYK